MRDAPEVRRRLESDIQTIFSRVLGRSDWVREFMLGADVSTDILMLSSPLSRQSSFILDTEEVQEGRLSGSIKLRYLVVPAFSTLQGLSGGAIVTSYARRNHPLHQPSVMATTRIGRYIRDSSSGEWLMITRNESDNVTRIQWLHSPRATTRERICITCNTDMFNKGLFLESILFQCRDDEWRPCPRCHAPPESLCECSNISTSMVIPKHPLDLPAVAAAALGEPKSEWFGRVQVSVFCNLSRDLRGDVDACMQLRTSFEANQDAALVTQMQNLALAERAKFILPKNVMDTVSAPLLVTHNNSNAHTHQVGPSCDFDSFLFDNSTPQHTHQLSADTSFEVEAPGKVADTEFRLDTITQTILRGNDQRTTSTDESQQFQAATFDVPLMQPDMRLSDPCDSTILGNAGKQYGSPERAEKTVRVADNTMRSYATTSSSELLVSHYSQFENTLNLGSFAPAGCGLKPYLDRNNNSSQGREGSTCMDELVVDDKAINSAGTNFLLDSDDENGKYEATKRPQAVQQTHNLRMDEENQRVNEIVDNVPSVASRILSTSPIEANSPPAVARNMKKAVVCAQNNNSEKMDDNLIMPVAVESVAALRHRNQAPVRIPTPVSAVYSRSNNGRQRSAPSPPASMHHPGSAVENDGSRAPLVRLEPRPPGMGNTGTGRAPCIWHLRPYGPVGMATVLASGERDRRAEERRRKNRQAAARSNARAKEILLRKQGELCRNKQRVAELQKLKQIRTEENAKLRRQLFGIQDE